MIQEANMSFEFAWWPLLLLLPLPLLVSRWRKLNSDNDSAPLRNVSLPLVETAQQGLTPSRQRPAILWLVWLLLLFAVARPQRLDEANSPFVEQGRDLLIAVDLSSSMEFDDMTLNGKVVDRLSAVRQLLSEFVQKRRGDRLGLILFADHAYLQSPLTFDVDTINQYVQEMTQRLVGDRTAIGEAIGMGVKQLMQLPNEQRILILLTDGQNTSGEVDPRDAAKVATDAGVTIYTIGIGATAYVQRTLFGRRTVNPSADLDESLLKDIAKQSGGQYFRATNTDELENIYQELDQLNPITKSEIFYRPRQELYIYPLAAASLMLAMRLFIPVLLACFIRLRRRHD
jgi:Ca-activated chloride channel family protein